MTPSAWIALATFALLILTGIGAGVWYTAHLVGALPGMLAKVIRDHERDCENFCAKEHTAPAMQALL